MVPGQISQEQTMATLQLFLSLVQWVVLISYLLSLQPQGLMFEFASEAGNQIWTLGRDLSTQYTGAPVEGLTTNATVKSAVNVPGTNQVRFTLDTGITLMYDYYYQQWGTFVNIPAISSRHFIKVCILT